jgi:hypothetical protein
MWVFLLIFATAVGYAAYAFLTAPTLRARDVAVHIDGPAVSEAAVRAAAQIDPNANVWLLDPQKIAQRIATIPYAGSVHVGRLPPAQLRIDVNVRVPAACVRSARGTVTVDRSRRILQTGCAGSDTLLVDEPGAELGPPGTTAGPAALADLLADAQTLRDAALPIRSIGRDRFGELVAAEPSGLLLLLGGDEDLKQKAELVAPVLGAAPSRGTVRAVDLRAPGTPTVEFR